MADLAIPQNRPLVSSREARAAGLKRYFTGEPCPHGHIAERWVGSGCVECARLRRNPKENYARVKAWRKLHPEKRTQEARRRRVKHPEKFREASRRFRAANLDEVRVANAAYKKAKRRSDPEGNRRRIAAFKARREVKLAEIAGRPRPKTCDLCGKNNGGIVFDHCHTHGHFRGWLCDRCNKVLGLVKDSSVLLEAMAKYVDRSNVEANRSEKKCTSG